ncbi:MAG: L,D-transpeptidase family protein [Erythrobacter sp.]
MPLAISHNVLKLAAAMSAFTLVAGCDASTDGEVETDVAATSEAPDYGYETYSDDNLADTMASNDGDSAAAASSMESDAKGPTPTPASTSTASATDSSAAKGSDAEGSDSEERPVMQLQVVLDRAGFGPGVIDGKMGMSTENALRGFQEANDLDVTGKHDEATKQALAQWDSIPATRVVTIPESWAEATFTEIPEDNAEKAKLEKMGYNSLDEKLAERFHTTIEVLKALNPDGRLAGTSGLEETPAPSSTPTTDVARAGFDGQFRPGQRIRVPNIGGDRIAPGSVEDMNWQRTLASLGVGSDQPEVDRIVVSKSDDTLKAYRGEKLVALFTVSSGSSEFPLPLGEWDILGEAYLPPYSYDPEVLGQGEGETYTFPPGPNSPVGIVWIDLSKEHYGIHGTPAPETIGRAQSSGCVRLTNWDAARLAQMVSQSTEVIFEA